ncbi:MAG: transporter substrate-binding domain-containing protein [Rhodospirillaceae bacterium]|nr:transporter substrate-binding domain-containing protein [Rhodospirillaceae bacterium]
MGSKKPKLYRASLAAVFLIGLTTAPSAMAAETIVMSYNADWPPYSFGAGAQTNGILPELMEEILSQRMGLKVRNVSYPWKRVQSSVKSGTVDAMVTVPTKARLNYTRSSQGIVYQLNMVLAVAATGAARQNLMADPAASTLSRYRVCDILGNGWGKRFFATNNIKPIIATKVVSCLRMTAKGRTDATLQAEAVLRRAISASQLENRLAVIPKPMGTMDFTLLLSKKSAFNAAFIQRFDAELAIMKADGSYAALVQRLRKGQP